MHGKVQVKLMCVTVRAMKTCRGSRGTAPLILMLCTKTEIVSPRSGHFPPPSPPPRPKEPLVPIETKAVWSPEPVCTFRRSLLAMPAFELRIIQHVPSKTNQMRYFDSLTIVHTAQIRRNTHLLLVRPIIAAINSDISTNCT
jgi:hypothetical protein